MDTKARTNKIVKDVQDSAREFGSMGLQMASKAVAFTATKLASLKDEMEKLGAKLKPEKTEPEEPVKQ